MKNEVQKNEMGTKRYRKLGAIWLTTCMLLLSGCGSAESGSSMAMDAATNGTSSHKYASSGMMMETGFYEEKAVEETVVDTSDTSNEREQDALSERKLIKTVNMTVETQAFDSLLNTVESQVKVLGGYIESMNTYNGSTYNGYGGTRNADMTIRIPKNELDAFLETVSGVSNVIRRSDTVEDVTLTYVDLESHRDALRTEQERLLELLEQAESLEDIITIEERLSNVRYQLESMESQLRTFDNQVDYSTVYLDIEEVEIYTPVEEESAWEQISTGFMESIEDIGDGLADFGIWFVIHIPYMVVFCIFVALFVGAILLFIKIVIKLASPKTQPTQSQQHNGQSNQQKISQPNQSINPQQKEQGSVSEAKEQNNQK